jgi:hypothetical protein
MFATVPIHAQTTFATISGRVADPSGAVIPGVTIEATNNQTGYEYRAQANESGAYTIPQLIEGTYTLRVTATGADVCARSGGSPTEATEARMITHLVMARTPAGQIESPKRIIVLSGRSARRHLESRAAD